MVEDSATYGVAERVGERTGGRRTRTGIAGLSPS